MDDYLVPFNGHNMLMLVKCDGISVSDVVALDLLTTTGPRQ